MSFWNNPGASFEGLMHDPWHSMENFGTTGLVPMIPYVAGAVGTFFGGPAGGMAAGSAAQEGVDYFSGNSDARTGKGIFKSLGTGAGKGYLGGMGASYGGDWLSGLGGESGGGMLDSIGGNGGSFGGDLFQINGGSGDFTSINPSTGVDWSQTGSGLSGNSFDGYTPQEQASLDNLINEQSAKYPMDNAPTAKPTFQQQLSKQLMKTNLGSPMQQASNYHYQEQPIQRQGAFQPVSNTAPIQDKPSDISALVSALRSKGTI